MALQARIGRTDSIATTGRQLQRYLADLELDPEPATVRLSQELTRIHDLVVASGLSRAGEKAAEVGVGRDQHPVLVSRSCQDLVVAGPRQAAVGRMHRVVSRRHEAFREAGRQALVDVEPQAGSSRGTRRSCSAAAA